MADLIIQKLDGHIYHVRSAERLVRWYFMHKTRVVDGFDRVAYESKADPNSISPADLRILNATMETMVPESRLAGITGRKLAWLQALMPQWDPVITDDETWAKGGCEGLIGRALGELWGPGRRIAVTTKLLHLKRPHLIPIIDRRLPWAIGPGAPAKARSAEGTIELIAHFRLLGQDNIEALKEVQDQLAAVDLGFQPSLTRILEVVLWGVASVDGPYDRLDEWLEQY